MIRKMPSGKYRVVSKKTGRNLGESDTKKGVLKRLHQVEYFKHKEDFASIDTIRKVSRIMNGSKGSLNNFPYLKGLLNVKTAKPSTLERLVNHERAQEAMLRASNYGGVAEGRGRFFARKISKFAKKHGLGPDTNYYNKRSTRMILTRLGLKQAN